MAARRQDDPTRLFRRYRRSRDSRTRELLVKRYTPLARSLALRYARGSEPLEDLCQVACVGLIKAVDRYDPERGRAFTSFAVPTILGELKRHFRDTTWLVHIPHGVHDRAMRVRKARAELTQVLGREPLSSELAAAAGTDEEGLAAALNALAAYEVASLEAPRRIENGRARSSVAGAGAEDDGLARIEQRADIDALVAGLPPVERQMLRLRFVEDLTQREIGDRLGVSQMSVSRTIRRVLQQLREVAEERGVSAA
jgi:RNA polymerase sigma-B factor